MYSHSVVDAAEKGLVDQVSELKRRVLPDWIARPDHRQDQWTTATVEAASI